MKQFHFLENIIFNENSKFQQLLRVGNFRNGTVKVTEQNLKDMVANFYKNARGATINNKPALPVNYSHMAEKEAAGWIVDLQLRNNNKELWANIEFNDIAKQEIQLNKFKFLSAEFAFNYVDAETQTSFGTVLKGAGLTNIPEVKNMKDITFSEQFINFNEVTNMNLEQILAFIASASPEDKAKLVAALNSTPNEEVEAKEKKFSEETAALKTKLEKAEKEKSVNLSETDKKLSELTASVEKLQADNKKLSEEKELSEKTAKFDKLLSEGKVCEAQRDAYMKGDMISFAEKAVKINLDEKGEKGGKAPNAPKTKEEAIEFIDSEAKKLAKAKNISLSEAQSQVREENADIFDLARS